jgi:hypothetical protein
MNLCFDKSIFFRFFIILVMAGTAVGLSVLNQSAASASSAQTHKDISITAREIDRQVDSVLIQFRIDKKWCRKRNVEIPGTNLNRVERKVLIPPEIIPVQMNQALNMMAQRYGGRAIGSENLRENSVTIHIKLEGYIIQTIILKTSKDLKRTIEKKQQRKI